jgi:hypothetical protein
MSEEVGLPRVKGSRVLWQHVEKPRISLKNVSLRIVDLTNSLRSIDIWELFFLGR